jgi:ferritin-like metal-binding protein YciE
MISEGNDQAARCADPEVRDAAILAALQYIGHFETAGYGTVCAYAKELGYHDVAASLHETLEEEKKMDQRMTDLAVGRINKKAKNPVVV